MLHWLTSLNYLIDNRLQSNPVSVFTIYQTVSHQLFNLLRLVCSCLLNIFVLNTDISRFTLVNKRRSHCLLTFLTTWWCINHFLRFKQNIVDPLLVVDRHTSRHPMSSVVCTYWYFCIVNKLVVVSMVSIARHRPDLFVSQI